MEGTHTLLATTLCGSFLAGLLLVLTETIRVPLAQHEGVAASRAGLLTRAFPLVLVPMMLGSGLLIDKWGTQAVLITALLVLSLTLTALALWQSRFASSVCLAGLGASTACVFTASVALMPDALVRRYPAASLNLGFTLVALGALTAPPLMDALRRNYGFRSSLLILGLLALAPAFLATWTPSGAFPVARTGDVLPLLRDPRLYVAAAAFFLHRPIEGSINRWADRYLGELGYPTKGTRTFLGLFWFLFLVTRVLIALAAPWLPAGVLLLIVAICLTITLGNLAGAYRPVSGLTGLLLVGACLAPLLPTLVAVLFQLFRGHEASAFGAMVAVGSTVSFLLPPFFDPGEEGHPARTAIRLCLGLSLVLTGLVLVLGLLT